MKQALQKAVDRLPEVLVQYAPTMMRRVIASMREQMATGGQTENASYCALLLKVGEADLVREFDAALREAIESGRSPAGEQEAPVAVPSLLLELVDETQTVSASDFAASTALFSTLSARARSLGVEGLRKYNKELFLAALMLAFAKARIEPKAMADLTPPARRALDGELLKIYAKVDAVGREPTPPPMAASRG